MEVEELIAASGQDLWLDKPAMAGFAAELSGTMATAERLHPGNRLGRYRILEKLGQGAVERARFVREAKAASALNHPNIVTIYETAPITALTSLRWSLAT